MKKVIAIILFVQLSVVQWSTIQAAAIGTWKAYMSYYGVQKIAAAGSDIFILSANSLWQYNQNDQSIVTYDKTTGMNGVTITDIAWNKASQRLIAVYDNCNIDLVETDGDIINVSDIYSKVITGNKTINHIYNNGKYAYLSCGFGVVKMNVAEAEISESYMLGFDVAKTAISGNNIYAQASSGEVWTAPLNANLIDKNNWNQTSVFDPSIFIDDNSDYEKYYPIVSTLNPGGPKYNYMLFFRFVNNKLYTCNGIMKGKFNPNIPGTVQVLEGDDWTIYQDNISSYTGHEYIDLASVDVDPLDPSHVFASGRVGLYEFRNGQFVKEYTYDNSDLQPNALVNPPSKDYIMIEGIKFDDSGNLWVLNSSAATASLFEITKEGKWISHHKNTFLLSTKDRSYDNMVRPMFDSRGLLWFCNDRFIEPALLCYQPSSDGSIAYRDFINQDGTKLEDFYDVSCIEEDKNGDLWIGTDKGPFVLEQSYIGKSAEETIFTQVKVPRNDGTNYADYLLAGVDVTCIKVDNDNRKWIGTNGQGVYVISSDNMTEVHHFTAENSQLISNIVGCIDIDESTGEVFIGTEKGLCSYMSGVTEPIKEMTKDNVYAYPNPVTPDFTGMITITGLMDNARVMILSSSGALIKQGRSSGRIFQWDGKDKDGKRVASGVYMVAIATSAGEKGTVCKIAVIN